jgi:DNA uptake protein ComE-like DNA-binding protein
MRKKCIALASALTLLGVAHLSMGAVPEAKRPPEVSTSGDQRHAASAKTRASAKKLVNLNAASAQELKRLPGGSDAEAARIIAGRPYNSKAFLVTRNIVSEGRYAQIKRLVVAGEPAPAAGKKTVAPRPVAMPRVIRAPETSLAR